MMRKWTNEEIKILRRNYSKRHSNISQLIKKGRTRKAIIDKAFELRISKNNKWGSKEVSFLRKSYKKLEVNKIAKKLGRTKWAIWTKAYGIGLKKKVKLRLPSAAYDPNQNLAWLVGYLLGDGYLTTGWTIGMKTKDNDLKEFYVKKFRKWSKCKNNKFVINQERGKYNDREKGKIYICKRKWAIRVCSKEAWHFLKKFKDDPLYSLKFFPKKYWKFLLKGLWDAEGNITPYKGNNRIVVGFSNSDEKILKLYEKICLNLEFHPSFAKRNGEKAINIYSLAEVLHFVDKVGITIERKRKKVMERINELRKKREVYYKVVRLRKEGLKRKQILEKLNGFLPPGTFDGWVYLGTKPYYIENAKAK